MHQTSAVKGTIFHIVLALWIVGAISADQTIQSVQQALKEQGYYYGNVSGDKSAETTAAVRRYQIRNGLQVTGDINQETLRSLNIGSNSAASPPIASSSPGTQPSRAAPYDRSQPRFESQPRSFSESDWPREVNRPVAGRPYEWSPSLITPRVLAEVQHQLASRGFYHGWIDGRFGPRTALAVRAFQWRAGIPPTGWLDMITLDALGVPARNMAYLESAPWQDSWTRIEKKFKDGKWKHGKWKAKWKKHHRDDDAEYGGDD